MRTTSLLLVTWAVCFQDVRAANDILMIYGGLKQNWLAPAQDLVVFKEVSEWGCSPISCETGGPQASDVGLFMGKVSGTMVVCGFSYTARCLTYHKQTNNWNYSTRFPVPLSSISQSSLMLDDGTMWITGSAQPTASTWLVNGKAELAKEGPNLPFPLSGHCLAKIDDNTVFLAGGVTLNGQTNGYMYTFKLDTKEWKRLNQSLSATSTYPACIRTGNKMAYLGGYLGSNSQASRKLTLYNLDTDTFEEGPDFEHPIARASVVAVGENDEFLVVGGESGDNVGTEYITMYSRYGTWEYTGGWLASRRIAPAVAMIGAEEMGCR